MHRVLRLRVQTLMARALRLLFERFRYKEKHKEAKKKSSEWSIGW